MLKISHLTVEIATEEGVLTAVDDVSLSIKPGETVGIVGESGSGKSVLAQSILRLNEEPPVSYPKGEILFAGENILTADKQTLRKIRAQDISIVFQDPMSSLNPVFTIGYQLIEAIQAREKMKRKEAEKRAIELLEDVGISDPKRRMKEYPHQFSGGMRQRVLLAIALAAKPKLLIADEPTTALDVTIQAQILRLLRELQRKYEMAILIITHDLGVVANIADHIYVMYAGRILEEGTVQAIFKRTANPYTWALLRSQPRLDEKRKERLFSISGQPPQIMGKQKGCNFYDRCPFAKEKCQTVRPTLRERGINHRTACLLSEEQLEKEIAKMIESTDEGKALSCQKHY